MVTPPPVANPWSGTTKLPEATPSRLNTFVCGWQVPGQCSRSTCHDSANAGRGLPSGSVAEPENATVSPTDTGSAPVGSSTNGTGVVMSPTRTVVVAISASPIASAARTRTVATPTSVKVWVSVGPVPLSNTPSLSTSQLKVSVSPASGSLDPPASNSTASGGGAPGGGGGG